MKKIILAISILAGQWVSAQNSIFQETFETDGNGTRYTTSIPEFTDNGTDFFGRTDGTNLGTGTIGFYNLTGAEGTYYFAGQDLDGEGAALPLTLTFNDIDVSGNSGLEFALLVAEDDREDNNSPTGFAEKWDATDIVLVEVDYDNSGSFTKLLSFETGSTDFNQEPKAFDANGSELGVLSANFTNYSARLSDANTIDIKITFTLDAGDEDIAFDNIIITEGNLSTDVVTKKQLGLTTIDGKISVSNGNILSVHNILGQTVNNENLSGIYFVYIAYQNTIKTIKVLL